jgi:hypothetical protein
MFDPVRLPATVCRLYEGGHPSHRLADQRLEDLYVWAGYELLATIIGERIRMLNIPGQRIALPSYKRLPLSPKARTGLTAFLQLFPEWLSGLPYMGIAIQERRSRLQQLFGDNPPGDGAIPKGNSEGYLSAPQS